MPAWEWMQQNTSMVSAIANLAMVLIWVFYFQVFLVSYLRQRRASIHIDRGAATDETARCIVTNMGEETVYLAAVVADLIFEGSRERALVTDKDELPTEQVHKPLEKTNKGPLKNGEARDIGSFWDLAQRANVRLGVEIPLSDLIAMEVTVVAASNQAQSLVGGCKRFSVVDTDDRRAFAPDGVLTRQIRSPWSRRRLRAMVDERLPDRRA
ncbi:MAG: hypothetical protein R6V44_09630 [Paracoccaceae bacterium]